MQPKPNARGFAFSADVVLALILVISVLVFVALPTQPASTFEERRITDQLVDDLFVSRDHSGYISQELDTNGFSGSTLQNIYTHASQFLPSNYDLFLQLRNFPVDVNACRTQQDFDSCFPDANILTLSTGTTLPQTASFVHGRRIFFKQQPSSQCSAALAANSDDLFDLFRSGMEASLQSSPDLNIQFDVNVSPDGPYFCDQNITVTLSVTADSGARKPVDVSLVFDRSGSMGWGGYVSTSDAQGLFLAGTNVQLADSTGGLRTIDVSTPNLPSLSDTYNSPGTARDAAAASSYAYLADGTSGLRVVNVSNPFNTFSAAQLDVGGDAYGVDSTGPRTYVVTYSPTNVDGAMTGGTNRDLDIGQSSSNQYGSQSFTPGLDFITGAMVYVRRVGTPGDDLQVNIRSSVDGSNLASATIPAGSITTTYQEFDVTFSTPLAISSGSTYYITLTTATNNSSNYYQWGARNGNAYGGGNAYQNTSAQNWDARFESHFISGLIVVDTSTPSSPQVVGAASLNDPWRVDVSSNYAYVADGSSGLRIFDVSTDTPVEVGSYNTPGNAYDIGLRYPYAFISDGSSGVHFLDISSPSAPAFISTYNTPGTAYAARSEGTLLYVADGSSLQIIDFSTIATPTFVDAYETDSTYRDLEVNSGWGYLAVDSGNEGLVTLDLANGAKIDQARDAAQTFVDFSGWDSNYDQMSLISYSSTATLDEGLTFDYNAVKDAIAVLASGGGTATGTAIDAATNELRDNGNPLALQFQVLMSDGQTNTGTTPATAAITAANAGIIIYTIGFGADADAAELTNIANLTGGQYYAATDANALQDVYALIAQEIQNLATDANVVTNFDPDTIVVDDGNGSFGGGVLIFDINTQQTQPWTVQYTFNIPCTSQLACSSSLISIPSPGTVFEYVDSNGNTVSIDWNVFTTQTFNFRDLNVEIVSGDLLGPGNADLSMQVVSAGSLDTNATEVRFYQGPPSNNQVIGSQSVPPLCGGADPLCSASTYTFTQNVAAEGELYAVVNPDGTIPECSYNNEDVIFCYSYPSTQFFTLDYWAWLHE